VFSGKFDAATVQYLLDSVWCTRQESRASLRDQSNVFWVKGIDIFFGVDAVEDLSAVESGG
jgi:hypothetical protein